MPCLVIYDRSTLEIVSSRTPGIGAVAPLTLDTVMPHIPDRHERYKSVWTEEWSYLTREARENLRIVDGDVVIKPRLQLAAPAVISLGEDASVTFSVEDTLPGELFNDLILSVDDEHHLPVNLENNTGEITISFLDPGIYRLRVNDDRFRTHAVEVEVVEIE